MPARQHHHPPDALRPRPLRLQDRSAQAARGPYTYWTRKQHGRTIARLLNAEQLERYQPQIDNARQLRQLVTALEALAIKAAEDAEQWGRK